MTAAAVGLTMWTIYDRPSDHPENAIARRWSIDPDDARPEALAIVARTVESLRAFMRAAGLTCLPRQQQDDPVIVESWI